MLLMELPPHPAGPSRAAAIQRGAVRTTNANDADLGREYVQSVLRVFVFSVVFV